SYPQTSTPSQPATSSSSSGTPTPGAYYNYPRTVSDGGVVEFRTSKVVKSVTLPAGSSGKVNLHIDSTAYWPLSLDSEFTFDISVDNLGEGTSYISFKIAESKLTALELTAADVGVYHNVNGEWVKLVVTYTIEDGDVIYTAETDSFSPFKLVIEEGAAVQKEEVTPSEPVVDEPVIPDVPQDVPGEVLPEIPDIQDEPETPASPAPVLGLLAALGAAVVLRRK
ncbi:PGF-pre-PGF domain-containing protein, partial [Methanocorpusculaceae archaeon]|nr:PGF-pre-PGF domain-containing protein [Methanocorpusculaceae archaeon]